MADLQDSDRSTPPPNGAGVVKTAEEGRQGQTTGRVRWILDISLSVAITALIIAYMLAV